MSKERCRAPSFDRASSKAPTQIFQSIFSVRPVNNDVVHPQRSTLPHKSICFSLEIMCLDNMHTQQQDKQQQEKQQKSDISPPTRRRLRSREKEDVGAPAVWVIPDWVTHPIIENFYGYTRHARTTSFDEIMCSPVNARVTTTLGENCCSYKVADDDDKGHQFVTRRPFGSFAYSCTTDTSEEGIGTENLLYDRHTVMGAGQDNCGSGYAHWNRMHHTLTLNGALVPVPLEPRYRIDRVSSVENSQNVGDRATFGFAFSFNLDSPYSSMTSARLRAKLQDSLHDMDTRIAEEKMRLNQIQQAIKQKAGVKRSKATPNAMWSLICGIRTDETSQADGMAFLVEELGIAVSHRALNQLQRHRRHVSGILQIVTEHNPDLELTERQLDSFEVADAMLDNDIKYSVLNQQYTLLLASLTQRRRAAAQAKLHNGNDCFEKTHVKSMMLSNLLEAVSWYRLVQRNAREESASSCVNVTSNFESNGESALSSGLTDVQVDTIFDVLAGEDFYSDYNKLMCQADWWEIAQAHFENLIFSSKHSRICQWIYQLSRDVAVVSFEELERNDRKGHKSRTNSTVGDYMHHKSHRQHPSWAEDPSPEQILDFLERLTSRVRREFDVANDVSKSLNVFIQRTVFPRIGVLCFNQKSMRECQRKDKMWRKKCHEMSGLPMENLGVSLELVQKIRLNLPSHQINGSSHKSLSPRQVFLVRAIEAFNGMHSIVPCDLLDELMHGVVILHHEAALVLGTTQFSVETFFPLLAYVLVHCRLPTIHAQLHLLENFAITADNANGEESYYVYCVHAAVEYVCNTAGLGVKSNIEDPTSSSLSVVSTPESSSFSPVMPILHKPSTELAISIEPELENGPSDSRSTTEMGVNKQQISESALKLNFTRC
ncbi:Vacuolar sorting protein 9 [Plasmopara halstedii]|uniref:Vacuolar sorting protein 9 n=1 Tax=Plasmopara halstedii TaxID=4781 RepID=A0A0P1AI64_PLAHL|nr:Vacuolar sorting protein 9 [Plasmopara halstedii]CEG40700.1 Vacuolar sorting protein 9 [Plasmopara halstedii]|eukprot:XP_024577069.1 Vacuolar sorting protein 9 [Plasmopara halstedii]